MGNGASKCEWRHTPEDFGRFWKSQWVELRLDIGREGLTFACLRWLWEGVAWDGGWGRWKSHNRKIALLSPYVEKLLNTKVIKSFVPEQRSRKCFSCFEIPMFYVIYIWTLYVHFAYPYLAMVQYIFEMNRDQGAP